MRVTLTVTAGPNQGQVFLFEQHDLFIVGRAPEAHFCLAEDPYFSRLHFMVEVNPPLCRIVDLRSRNGTSVNGRKLQQPYDLQNGDEIEGGKTRLRVLLALPDQQPPATLALAAPMVAAGEGPDPSSSSLSRELPLPVPMAGMLGADSSAANQSGSQETPIPISELPTAPPGEPVPAYPTIAGYRIIEKVKAAWE
jgi:eukaryotic-like serine/threonine-protein kinase